MKIQILITSIFAAAAVAGPIGSRGAAVHDKRQAETNSAAKWPSLPTIAERDVDKRQAETNGAAKWPSLPTIAERTVEGVAH